MFFLKIYLQGGEALECFDKTLDQIEVKKLN